MLIAVTITGVRQLRSGARTEAARRAGWVLWGGWLLLVGLVLSVAQGGFHSYYTTEMAPAVAAVTAAGVAAMWRHYRRPGGYRWLLFPAAVTLTAGWAWVLVSRNPSWNGWLGYAVGAVGAVTVLLLVAGRLSVQGTSCTMSRVAGVLAVVTVLAAPGVWSTVTAFAASGGAMAQAGPPSPGFGGFGRGGPKSGSGRRSRAVPGHHARKNLTAEQSRILAYAQANSGNARITRVEGGAMAAEAYLIHSDATVIGMGGFSGQDPAPTMATLTQWVQQGQLRFVLTSGRDLAGHGVGGRGTQQDCPPNAPSGCSSIALSSTRPPTAQQRQSAARHRPGRGSL